MYHNVALSGGGAHVLAFVGCLRVLENEGMLRDVVQYVTSSAGSLLGLMMVLGNDLDKIERFVRTRVFGLEAMRINLKGVWNFVNTYGVDDGAELLALVEEILRDGGMPKEVTFVELAKRTGKNLVVATANVNRSQIEFMSLESSPDLEVRMAIRMSASVPLLYCPVKYKGDYYVDGLFFDNFPVNYFHGLLENTLGLNIVSHKKRIDTIWDFFRNLFAGTVQTHSRIVDHSRTKICEIDCSDVENFDVAKMRFSVDQNNMEALLRKGEESAKTFLLDGVV
jgi:predicted acylesterase/phospholipase RssA